MAKSGPVLHWILSPADLEAQAALVDKFFTLYVHEDNFPDENEREEPRFIRERIGTDSQNPNTNLLVYTVDGGVRGGAILEYYPKSECCLLTYLFVEKEFRTTGIARTLIEADEEKGLPGLIGHFRRQGRPVRAVFFESNNPFRTPEANDSMHPSRRLKAFYKLCAKRVDIDYVQPPLDPDKAPVTNLYLCTFPRLSGQVYLLEIRVLLCFLVEFYHSLKALAGDFPDEFRRAQEWKPGARPDFATAAIREMYESLLRSEYVQYGITYLKELPLLEEPRLLFERASVCLEILVDETYYALQARRLGETDFAPVPHKSGESDPMAGHNQNDAYCIVTHSFETDLLAYAYQAHPPFYTRCFNFPSFREVTIRFPQVVEFVSEGRQETRYMLPQGAKSRNGCIKTIRVNDATGTVAERVVKEVRARVFLNYTYFYKSEIRVWHLVFSAVEKHGLDELDVIKLMKFFSGSQESRTEADKQRELANVKFLIPGGGEQEYDLPGLFQALSGIRYRQRKSASDGGVSTSIPPVFDIRNGVVGIDTDYCRFLTASSEADQEQTREVLAQLFGNLRTNEEGKKVSSIDVQRQYAHSKNAEYVFEAFCGITLGIFDYDRMGFEEVSDTLVPRSTTESSFLTINRGVLSSFGYGDSVLGASIQTVGMNPYLQIPSAVLAHNEYVSNDAFRRSTAVLEALRADENVVDIKQLETARKQIRHLLNMDFLPNVFQYPTEQDLYTYGLDHRGVLEKNQRTRGNLEQIDNVIDEANANLNHRYQFWVNVLLMVISIFQIYEVITSLITEVGGPRLATFPVLIKLLVLILLIAICVFISYRLYQQSSIDTGKRFILKRKGE